MINAYVLFSLKYVNKYRNISRTEAWPGSGNFHETCISTYFALKFKVAYAIFNTRPDCLNSVSMFRNLSTVDVLPIPAGPTT
jgi:hypothetical protein